MSILLFVFFSALSVLFFYLFLKGPYKYSPLWLMLSVWGVALGVPRLNLSSIEKTWSIEFWLLVSVSLISFIVGFFTFDKFWRKYPVWHKLEFFKDKNVSVFNLRLVVYILFIASCVGLYLFYVKAGNFPLLAPDPDAFRFKADEDVPGLINYSAQLARLFIPLSFFIIFWQRFSLKKHWDLALICLFGTAALIVFASRTQIFFIDLWIMAMYLFMRKPNLRQAVRFYPIFLLVSVVVLAAVPLIRQYKTYGEGYLTTITGIDQGQVPGPLAYLVPIYVGISFNMQALLHAHEYYKINELQYGKVTLDPFTNILGLDQFKSNYDLGEIFFPWWNTGTYLFPFVQDFGVAAFFFVPAIIAGILTLLWHYWRTTPNYLSVHYYAYAVFFMVMTIYLSFTVRAEMYIDIFLIFLSFAFVKQKDLFKIFKKSSPAIDENSQTSVIKA